MNSWLPMPAPAAPAARQAARLAGVMPPTGHRLVPEGSTEANALRPAGPITSAGNFRDYDSHEGYPLLAGWSRKSSLGAVTGIEVPADRVRASVAAALLAVERGARIVRVHDVRETVEALKIWAAAR